MNGYIFIGDPRLLISKRDTITPETHPIFFHLINQVDKEAKRRISCGCFDCTIKTGMLKTLESMRKTYLAEVAA